jgi:rod shape-determining protein MreB
LTLVVELQVFQLFHCQGIVCDESIRIAGDEFTADIIEAMRRYHSLLIGDRTAEQIKIQVGSALKELDSSS